MIPKFTNIDAYHESVVIIAKLKSNLFDIKAAVAVPYPKPSGRNVPFRITSINISSRGPRE